MFKELLMCSVTCFSVTKIERISERWRLTWRRRAFIQNVRRLRSFAFKLGFHISLIVHLQFPMNFLHNMFVTWIGLHDVHLIDPSVKYFQRSGFCSWITEIFHGLAEFMEKFKIQL